jgi:hypothetical protein
MVRPNKKSWLAGQERNRKKRAGQDDSFLSDAPSSGPKIESTDREGGSGRWAVCQGGRQEGSWVAGHRRPPVTAGNNSVSNIADCMLGQGELLPASCRTGGKGHSQYNSIQALY